MRREFVLLSLLLGLVAAPAVAQVAPAHIQSPVEALAQDAAEYARLHAVPLSEAMRRLRAQEESVAATDAIRERFRDRLAGIAIEHSPAYRIVVLLTGDQPVAEEAIFAAGIAVPVVYRTGAAANRETLIAALSQHRAAIRRALPGSQGMGVDPRTGELVLMVRTGALDLVDWAERDVAIERLTGVPVRIRLLDKPAANFALSGGARVEGVEPTDGRRYSCTTGFVVTDSRRTGLVTAAHCPDSLTYVDPAVGRVALGFVGQWGARYQDVQVHVADVAQEPLFYANSAKTLARTLTGWRNRESTRAGDMVCHRGERTGYSCAEVELIDFAPPGDLCGGPCDPMWVTVAGPTCKSGDSGGPIFNGTTAFGIVKGGSYRRDGSCNFYFYMSTDYLPEGWRLLHARSPASDATARDVVPVLAPLPPPA